MHSNPGSRFANLAALCEKSRAPRPPKALVSDASVGALLRARLLCKVRAYLDRPLIHAGPPFVEADLVYFAAVVGAGLALLGLR